MKDLLLASVLLLAGCRTADTPRSTIDFSERDGCVTRLTATMAHPFLAEFDREVSLNCKGSHVTLTLQRDSGGLGRVELVRLDNGLFAITDAFQSTTVRRVDSTVLDLGLHGGKVDSYPSPCARTQVFHRAQGTFLGAFDYCDHQWQFLPAR